MKIALYNHTNIALYNKKGIRYKVRGRRGSDDLTGCIQRYWSQPFPTKIDEPPFTYVRMLDIPYERVIDNINEINSKHRDCAFIKSGFFYRTPDVVVDKTISLGNFLLYVDLTDVGKTYYIRGGVLSEDKGKNRDQGTVHPHIHPHNEFLFNNNYTTNYTSVRVCYGDYYDAAQKALLVNKDIAEYVEITNLVFENVSVCDGASILESLGGFICEECNEFTKNSQMSEYEEDVCKSCCS